MAIDGTEKYHRHNTRTNHFCTFFDTVRSKLSSSTVLAELYRQKKRTLISIGRRKKTDFELTRRGSHERLIYQTNNEVLFLKFSGSFGVDVFDIFRREDGTPNAFVTTEPFRERFNTDASNDKLVLTIKIKLLA